MVTGDGDVAQPVDPGLLRDVLRQMEAAGVDELEVTHAQSRLFLRRHPGSRAVPTGREVLDTTPDPARTISAPLTGVYYARPSPEQEPFLAPGDTVEVGQVVALIETMKLFNEVTSDLHGEVIEVMAKDGDLVEVGQALVTLRPLPVGETG